MGNGQVHPTKRKDLWRKYLPGKGKLDDEYFHITPNEKPVCCDDTPKEVDRFDPDWKMGETFECGKCHSRWCKHSHGMAQ